ncbi:MAG: hypothetical protein HY040_28570 [Planctomycetes bacterium]|nr:hypothetical protein [Planctomycetota bacterium]
MSRNFVAALVLVLALIVAGAAFAENYREATVVSNTGGAVVSFKIKAGEQEVQVFVTTKTVITDSEGKKVSPKHALQKVCKEGSIVDVTTMTVDGKAYGKAGKKVEIATEITQLKPR